MDNSQNGYSSVEKTGKNENRGLILPPRRSRDGKSVMRKMGNVEKQEKLRKLLFILAFILAFIWCIHSWYIISIGAILADTYTKILKKYKK